MKKIFIALKTLLSNVLETIGATMNNARTEHNDNFINEVRNSKNITL